MSDHNSCSNRFNAFHLEVSILADRMGWLLEKLWKPDVTPDHPGFDLLQQVHSDLESLIEVQDCREDASQPLEPLHLASSGH